MYSVYVLRSLRNGKRYVGYTGQPVAVRVRQHNTGQNRWANQNRPFELQHVEEFAESSEARAREKFLKTGAGRRELDRLLLAK
jgi:predicted GIY-YIG superfamily endonuclease